MEFMLHAETGSPGFVVTIKYPNAGAYMIYNEDRNPINPTDWDSAEKTWGAVTGSFCGEWRYEGVINRL